MPAAGTWSRSQRILSGAQDDSTVLAENALASFERMWADVRVLGQDPSQRQQLLSTFLKALREYTSEFGPLGLHVEPFALTLDGIEVFKVDGDHEHYIHRLHRDGVRRVVFHPELDSENLDGFVQVLATNFTDPQFCEDDIATLLWEKNLEGIAYRRVPTFAEGAEDEGEGIAKAKAAALESDEIIERALTKVAVPAPADSLRVARSSGVESEPGSLSDAAASVFDFGEGKRLALSGSIAKSRRQAPTKFGEIACYTMFGLGEEAHKPVGRAFGNYAMGCLLSGEAERLRQSVSSVRAIGDVPKARKVSAALIGELKRPAIIEACLDRIVDAELTQPLLELLGLVGRESFPALFARMLLTEPGEKRNQLLNLVARLASKGTRYLVKQVGKGDEEAALIALSLIKRTDVGLIARDLLVGLQHPSARVRLETANALRRINDTVVNQVLIHLLDDPDSAVRVLVTENLVRFQVPEVGPRLFALMNEDAFWERTEDELAKILPAFGRVADADGLALMRRVALQKPKRKAPREARIAAIRVLAARADKESLFALEALARKLFIHKTVKTAARSAATTIRRAVTRV